MRNGQFYQIGNVQRGYGALELYQVVTEFVFAHVMCDYTVPAEERPRAAQWNLRLECISPPHPRIAPRARRSGQHSLQASLPLTNPHCPSTSYKIHKRHHGRGIEHDKSE